MCRSLNWSSVLSYSSVKFIRVENWRLGAVYYSLVLSVLSYVIVYSLVLKKGYQEYDNVVGTATLKVKGSGYSGNNSNPLVMDAYDVINPPTEQNALFLSTASLRTVQTRSVCTGSDMTIESCKNDSDCTRLSPTFNGVKTGECNSTAGFCQLYAWCPLENDSPAQYKKIEQIDSFSIFIKVNSIFPKFSVTTNNVNSGIVRLYNQFTPSEMLQLAGSYSFSDIILKGAIILCQIEYDCDLNQKTECDPVVKFTRIDDSNQKSFSPGFNYRYTIRTFENGEEKRILVKVMGMRILFNIYGMAGRFSVVMLFLTLGAGVGLLGVSTVICDFILQYFLPNKEKYLHQKYEHIRESYVENAEIHRNNVVTDNYAQMGNDEIIRK